MAGSEKFSAIRKGLLEFLILKIVATDKVYVADILKRLSSTEFATQEDTLYPLLSTMRREGLTVAAFDGLLSLAFCWGSGWRSTTCRRHANSCSSSPISSGASVRP